MIRIWLRIVAVLVPADVRAEWVQEWEGELAVTAEPLRHARGALADAWYLRTEGWTMDAFLRDVKNAWKGLVRRPGFTALAALTLAVGIGANTAIYSVVDAVLINPLPLPDPDRVVSYNYDAPGLGVNVPLVPHSEASFVHHRDQARTVESLAIFTQAGYTLVTDVEPAQLNGALVSARYFDVLGVQPVLGRAFVEGEDVEGAEDVVVISTAVWEQWFGRDESILGRLIELDGVQHRVVGVMPAGAALRDEQIWVPITIDPAEPVSGSFAYIGVGRLAEGVDIEAANLEMEALLQRYMEDSESSTLIEQAGFIADVKPLKEVFVEDMRQPLLVLLGTVGFVLLIACANVANLFLVRAEGRQREVALRTAMGASRLDVVRQYLTEALSLSLLGGVVGLALAGVGVRALLGLAPAEIPTALDVGIDSSVLVYTLVISILTGLLFGVFPVLGAGRGELGSALREGGRSTTDGRERHRARSALVVTQVALALVLLVGSGLMFRSFAALRDVDLGFSTDGLLTLRLGLPSAEYESSEDVLSFHRTLMDRVAGTPGVTSVGMIDGLPLTDAKSASPMEPLDMPFADDELAPLVEQRRVSPRYFEAMSIRIVDGRALEWTDQADEFRGVVVTQALADVFWPGQSAVGRAIRNQGNDFSWEVVGVAADVHYDGIREAPLPKVYMPLLFGSPDDPAATRAFDLVVGVQGDPLGAVDAVREAVVSIDPRLPVINPRTVEAIVEDALSGTSFTVVLLGIAAAIALLLGTVGIYAVISYMVTRRTQEIGVRMALGAPAALVLRSVMGDGMALTGVGVLLGLGGAWVVSRVLGSLLYGVSATDPLTFVATPVALLGVALLATWLPARRAARVDPVEALRAE